MCDWDFNAHAETYVADKHVDDFGRTAHANLNACFPSLVPVGPGSTALDFGAGGGNIAFRLSMQGVERVVALDPAENMIKVLKRRMKEQNIVGVTPFVGTCDDYVRAALDTAQTPDENKRVNAVASTQDSDEARQDGALPKEFDLITASSVLAFVNDKVATLRCLAKMLRDDASHIVHWDWLAQASPSCCEDEGSAEGVTLDGVRKLHSDCGLQTVSCDVGFKYLGMSVVLGVAKRMQ